MSGTQTIDRSPMRTEKELLIATKQYSSENRLLSWWHLLSTIAVFIGLFTLTWMDTPLWLRIPAGVCSGLTFVRLFCIYHDFAHHSILHGSKLAKVIMYTYGFLGLSPPSIWIRSHNHHHNNNSKLHGIGFGSYPLMTTDEWAVATKRERFTYAATRHPLTIACGYITIFLFGMCIRSFFISPKRHWDCGVTAVLHVGILAWVATYGLDVLAFSLLLPIAVASCMGAYLFYAQHNFPGVQYGDREDWTYVKAALKSSSYIKMNPLMRWFTANIGYHHIHHLNHRIPFYRLPEAMAGLPELQSPVSTTLSPKSILACFRSKLWCVEEKRYVPFNYQPPAPVKQTPQTVGIVNLS